LDKAGHLDTSLDCAPAASLDAIATQQIKAAIDNLKSRRTVLVISHNLPLIMDADVIHVMRGGEIVESPTYRNCCGPASNQFFSAMI